MVSSLAIAEICHEANRAYCRTLGDLSQLPWANAPDWQKDSALSGVQFHRNNPNSTPKDSHENWVKEKVADGWTYGIVKDVDNKKHPCIVSYELLPAEQQLKDQLFVAIVHALSDKVGC